MKKINLFKMLAVLVVLITSFNTAWATDYVYLSPGQWKAAGRLTAFFCSSDDQGAQWINMTKITDDLYRVAVPATNNDKLIFLRMDPDKSNAWGNKWNQTSDLTPTGNEGKVFNIPATIDGEWNYRGSWGSVVSLFPSGKRIYFKPCSKWKEASARFAMFCVDGNDDTWLGMTQQGSTGYYYADIPNALTAYVVLCRMDPSKSGYGWTKNNPLWAQTSNIAPDGSEPLHNLIQSTSDTYDTPTTSWWDYAPNATVIGSFNSWDRTTGTYPLTGAGGTANVTLSATSDVEFKILEGETWHGSPYMFVGQSSSITMNTSDNGHVITGDAGEYKFTYNSGTQALTVEYPDSHPSSNYVYFNKSDDWGDVFAYRWGGTAYNTDWPGWGLGITTIGDADYAFMPIYGASNFIFNKNEGSGDSEIKTPDLSLSTNAGKQYTGTSFVAPRAGSWSADFPITITLAKGDHGAENGTAKVNYNATALTSSTHVSANTGYNLSGYYDGSTKVLNADGSFASTNVTGYITSSQWTHNSNCTLTAKFTAKTTTVSFNQTSGSGGQTSSVTATYDVAMPTPITRPTRAGYSFQGYWDGTGGTGTKYYNADGSSARNWDKEDATCTLHAKWTEVALTFSTAGNWNDATKWSPACVPTSSHDVTISANVTVDNVEKPAVAKSVTISSGVLTIEPTGRLVVAGKITNTTAANIVINTDDDNQGALIFDNSDGEHPTAATVNLRLQHADPDGSNHFQMIAIPVPYVSVSEKFEGKGVYTYGWNSSDSKWERRNYYSGFSAFEALLVMGKNGVSFEGNLVSTAQQEYSGLTCQSSKENGDVHMFGNSWTAPIQVSSMTLSNIVGGSVHIFNGSSNSWDGAIYMDVIPALQGYAVRVTEGQTGSVTVNYSAVRAVADDYRTEVLKAPKHQTSENPDPIIVYVSGNEMRTRIRLFEDATRFSDEMDEGWEAVYIEGEHYAGEMYAIGTQKMNVLATSNLEGTVVGFVPGQAESYTISFAGDGKGYYLNDVKTGKSTLIDEDNTYEFTSDESTNATRFVISKMPMQPTGIDAVIDGSNVRKQMIDGKLYIIRDGRIYTTTGAVVK